MNSRIHEQIYIYFKFEIFGQNIPLLFLNSFWYYHTNDSYEQIG